jgi:hypothetical protein
MVTKRDSKDPAPTARNSERQPPDGNSPATGELHGSKKAEVVKGDQRFGPGPNVDEPTRQNGDGNTPVTGEMHGQKKAAAIPADRRF